MAEMELDQIDHREMTTLTAEIVGAYVGHHTVATTDLPALIATVGQQLAVLNQAPAEPKEEKPVPAVPIKRSVCQSALNIDPLSASNFDPLVRHLMPALSLRI